MSTVDITPSPRVLRMLGQIDFQPWQCLAELVDNSIDAFIDQSKSGAASASPRISIGLPSEAELKAGSGVISISDNGSGMSLETLKDAVKAGYSGNDPVEKMGLFGMGFNISTARMGRRTEVWTTRADDPDWTGLIIDFGSLERKTTFHAPVETRSKTADELDRGIHGTEIRISLLEADRVRPLIKGAGKKRTRERLGKIYGRVMTRLGIEILYDGDIIVPWEHCAWSALRSVETQTFGNVPARLDIDEELGARRFCTTCWVWLLDEDDNCASCGHSDHVVERKRKLKGWIGIQRYFDKDHFGVDLVRNGRVIEELDKSFFTFTDENGDAILEYPIDAIHWGGRIIGELEIDFVRVSHQKDSFDKLDPEWKHVVEIVRGRSPLQPRIAEKMGLGKNDSPLSRLFTAYRKGTAGLKDLVPGTVEGSGLNSGAVKEYVERFYAGEAAYQSDEKWYELVLQAERGKRGGTKGSFEAGGDFPIFDSSVGEDPSGAPTPTESEETATGDQAPSPPAPPPIEVPEVDHELSGTYEVDELPGSIAIKVTALRHKEDIDGSPFTVTPEGFLFRFAYNARSPFFEESLEAPLDHMLVDLAQYFLVLSSESVKNFPVSYLARVLKEKYFASESATLSSAATAAGSMIDELRRHYDERLPSVAPVDLALLTTAEQGRVIRAAIKANGISEAEARDLIVAGAFARFASTPFMLDLVRAYPSLAMDGQFFNRPYTEMSGDLQTEMVVELADSLQDIIWLADEGASAVSKDTGWRLRYARALSSLRLLQYWRA